MLKIDTPQGATLVVLKIGMWKELREVNKTINRAVKYRTDRSLYNVADFWTIADKEGDCEDYALRKRKALIDRGWPSGALRIAICETNQGGHAVLTVDTDIGSYVLDNNTDSVVPWRALPYTWVARQKPNSREWERI